jgi:hypothetical protein
MNGSGSKGATPGFSDSEQTLSNAMLTDGSGDGDGDEDLGGDEELDGELFVMVENGGIWNVFGPLSREDAKEVYVDHVTEGYDTLLGRSAPVDDGKLFQNPTFDENIVSYGSSLDEKEEDLRTDGGLDRTEEWTHAGLDCRIIHTDLGHWCGYVRRPEDAEPIRWTSDWDSNYDDFLEAEVDVFGGITYGPDDDGWVGFDDAHRVNLVDERDEDTDREAVKAETERLAEQIAEFVDADEVRADGGLDARTVDPGDVVEVAGSPYRVVDVIDEEDDGVLRLYDLVERTETIKAAGAGDVSMYLHRSEEDAIRHRVEQEREQRDVQEDDVYSGAEAEARGIGPGPEDHQEDDVDEGDGVETDGGSEFADRVDEMIEEIEYEIEDSTPTEAMLYARCSAAFEDAVNNTDLPPENALGVMTAALFEAADTVGYARSDVIETAREHYIDEGGEP